MTFLNPSSIAIRTVKLKTMRKSWFLLLAFSLSACHSIQQTARPALDFPEQSLTAVGIVESVDVQSEWWQAFRSPQLTALIERAHQHNPDLKVSAERVRQAELQMRIAGASLFPSFSLSGSTGSGRSREDGGAWKENESSRVSLGVSYEVDLWGRVSAGRASAEASFQSTQFDQAASQLSITGAVANAWFQWLTVQQRIASAEENIRIAERVLEIVQVRYRNGVATSADVSRQQTNLLSQRSTVIPLRLQSRQTQAALAVLVGESPLTFQLPNAETLMALQTPQVSAGIPNDLFVRRPDVAIAEAQLYAADADVAAARAALLPSVQLGASLGRSANVLFSLGNPADSASWSLSLAQTLFAGGRLRNQVAVSESRRVVLVEQYRSTLLRAVQEANDAIDRQFAYEELEASQQAVLNEAERTFRLTEVRYREGSDDLMSLLEAQRTVFQARDQLAQQRLSRLSAAVDVYLALGGGWKNAL